MAFLISTRSNSNEDARRDFDGFDIDDEMRLFREACRQKDWKHAAEFMSNIDEYLVRGGEPPNCWVKNSNMKLAKRGYDHRQNRQSRPADDEYVEVQPERLGTLTT